MHSLAIRQRLILVGLFSSVVAPASWAENDLTLEPVQRSCSVQAGDAITILLTVSDLRQPVNGVQVFLEFNNELWSFENIIPGDGVGSPWDAAWPLTEVVDGGNITYALGFFASGTDEDAVVARFNFVAQADGVAEVDFRTSELNKLTRYPDSVEVLPDLHGPAHIVVAQPGDGNADGVIDLEDFSSFAACLTGPPESTPEPAYPVGPPDHCCCFDLDADGDVDLEDFAVFQGEFDAS